MIIDKKYLEAVGRRKTAIARIRLVASQREHITINDKDVSAYFPTLELRQIAHNALKEVEEDKKFSVTARVVGGGIHAQAEAIRHGISRALSALDLEFRKKLKKLGYLKRDPRAKERRKFGLKKARKAPQWSKR